MFVIWVLSHHEKMLIHIKGFDNTVMVTIYLLYHKIYHFGQQQLEQTASQHGF